MFRQDIGYRLADKSAPALPSKNKYSLRRQTSQTDIRLSCNNNNNNNNINNNNTMFLYSAVLVRLLKVFKKGEACLKVICVYKKIGFQVLFERSQCRTWSGMNGQFVP